MDNIKNLITVRKIIFYLISGGYSKTACSHGDLFSWDKSYLSTGSGKTYN